MKTYRNRELGSSYLSHKLFKTGGHLALLLITALILAACGGDSEPTATPTSAPTAIPPTATTAPAATTPAETDTPEAASAPESPLAQPESPLSQPESPLAAATAVPKPMNEDEAVALAATTKAPEPQKGFGSVSGVVYSYGINQAVPGTIYYLTPADEEDGKFSPPILFIGPQLDKGDIVGTTTMQGQVSLDNVPPGHYYMMLWTVYNWLPLFPTIDSEDQVLITVEEGDKVDLGVLYVNWP